MTLKREKQANCQKQVVKGGGRGINIYPKEDDAICERSLLGQFVTRSNLWNITMCGIMTLSRDLTDTVDLDTGGSC